MSSSLRSCRSAGSPCPQQRSQAPPWAEVPVVLSARAILSVVSDPGSALTSVEGQLVYSGSNSQAVARDTVASALEGPGAQRWNRQEPVRTAVA